MRLHALIVAAVACAMMFAGCAAQQQLTRQQRLDYTTRTYHGVTKDQVLQAAEEVFRLSDADHFTFAHTPESLVATRKGVIYLVLIAAFVNDHWVVSAEEQEDGGIRAHVRVSTNTTAVTGAPTGAPLGAVVVPIMSPSAEELTQGSATYDLFWNRMDYLLDKSDSWRTCGTQKALIKSANLWGNNDPLCLYFLNDDLSPQRKIVGRR